MYFSVTHVIFSVAPVTFSVTHVIFGVTHVIFSVTHLIASVTPYCLVLLMCLLLGSIQLLILPIILVIVSRLDRF